MPECRQATARQRLIFSCVQQQMPGYSPACSGWTRYIRCLDTTNSLDDTHLLWNIRHLTDFRLRRQENMLSKYNTNPNPLSPSCRRRELSIQDETRRLHAAGEHSNKHRLHFSIYSFKDATYTLHRGENQRAWVPCAGNGPDRRLLARNEGTKTRFCCLCAPRQGLSTFFEMNKCVMYTATRIPLICARSRSPSYISLVNITAPAPIERLAFRIFSNTHLIHEFLAL
ncbi:hypothetical protein R3P38DRAFT_1109733 [Favolaschia claudopus]|uniref:Uncharacterized protein n=1 Tax=Favolaschia claudopus TaxID=2862362 RepID=A0AAW0B7S9_9AGAR